LASGVEQEGEGGTLQGLPRFSRDATKNAAG